MKRRRKNRKPNTHNRNPYTVMDERQLDRPARLCRKIDAESA